MKKYIEDLKTALLCCSSDLCGGENCPYYHSKSCHQEFIKNTLSLINEYNDIFIERNEESEDTE